MRGALSQEAESKVMLGTIRAFWNDQRGIAMILVAIMLPVLIGFALLAIDMSRANGLHNDMQKGADAYALALAAELDGNTDAITRANRARDNLFNNAYANTTKFSTSGNHPLGPADLTVTYLSGIPADDSIALNAAGVDANGHDWSTTDPKVAKFAEVTVNPTAFAAIFPASFLGGSNGFNVQTQAVAGFTNALCQFTPMFICNPYANIGALQTALSGTKKPMIWLKEQQGGASAQYGPGNYGFLSSPEGDKNTAAITEMFAITNPPACYSQNGVTTRPGNIPPVDAGINTRFDIYDNGGPYKTDPAINPPAPNVRKGMVVSNAGKNNCSYSAPNSGQAKNYKALPRDNCFTSGSCAQAGVLGDGTWDFSGYWTINHGNASTSGVTTACGASPSRYCVYKYEVNNPALKSGQEATAPQCNTTTQGADRRLIYVAIIDCTANSVKGGGQTLPVQAFGSVFITEPAGGAPNADIYGEMQDISTSVGQGTLKKLQRNEAQLYR
ncbi:pilus assembly protein TadG-related protein [Mesorhizobium australicum]|uniref:TadE/TadG family type IV pilus assembly protein n=1 Tax=Mesorhizobium australicum TaxID=536018 RepID=UPI0033396B31